MSKTKQQQYLADRESIRQEVVRLREQPGPAAEELQKSLGKHWNDFVRISDDLTLHGKNKALFLALFSSLAMACVGKSRINPGKITARRGEQACSIKGVCQDILRPQGKGYLLPRAEIAIMTAAPRNNGALRGNISDVGELKNSIRYLHQIKQGSLYRPLAELAPLYRQNQPLAQAMLIYMMSSVQKTAREREEVASACTDTGFICSETLSCSIEEMVSASSSGGRLLENMVYRIESIYAARMGSALIKSNPNSADRDFPGDMCYTFPSGGQIYIDPKDRDIDLCDMIDLGNKIHHHAPGQEGLLVGTGTLPDLPEQKRVMCELGVYLRALSFADFLRQRLLSFTQEELADLRGEIMRDMLGSEIADLNRCYELSRV